MTRFAWILALALGAVAARADVAPDYPLTQNRYRFRLAESEGFDAQGAHLVLVTTSRPRDEPAGDVQLQRADADPVGIQRWHWSRVTEHRLVLVRGELPQELTAAWLESAEVLAELKLTGKVHASERAKGDDEAFRTQTYDVVVTPKVAGETTTLGAKRVKVTRQDRDGKTLETEDLDDSLSLLRPATGAPLLALAGLLGLLGLGGLGVQARRRAA